MRLLGLQCLRRGAGVGARQVRALPRLEACRRYPDHATCCRCRCALRLGGGGRRRAQRWPVAVQRKGSVSAGCLAAQPLVADHRLTRVVLYNFSMVHGGKGQRSLGGARHRGGLRAGSQEPQGPQNACEVRLTQVKCGRNAESLALRQAALDSRSRGPDRRSQARAGARGAAQGLSEQRPQCPERGRRRPTAQGQMPRAPSGWRPAARPAPAGVAIPAVGPAWVASMHRTHHLRACVHFCRHSGCTAALGAAPLRPVLFPPLPWPGVGAHSLPAWAGARGAWPTLK